MCSNCAASPPADKACSYQVEFAAKETEISLRLWRGAENTEKKLAEKFTLIRQIQTGLHTNVTVEACRCLCAGRVNKQMFAGIIAIKMIITSIWFIYLVLVLKQAKNLLIKNTK